MGYNLKEIKMIGSLHVNIHCLRNNNSEIVFTVLYYPLHK